MTTQEQIYIGLAVSGATSETKAIATFDNLTVTQEDANTIISASETNIISGTNVTFTNESLNTAVSQKWSFYGATISSSSAKSPVVCFIVPGTYPVSLVVTDSEGNKSLSNTLNINVVAPGLLISPVTSTTSWKLKSVSSEEISAEDGAATNAFDGDPNTYWHTKYHNGVSSYPHEIQIDLGSLYDLTGIGYLPRMGASGTNGRFKYFNIYASVDGNNWTFVRSATGSDDEYEKAYGFETVKAHYIKIIGTSACNYSKFGGAAEIKAYGTISDVNDVKNIIKPEFEIYSTRNKVYIDTGEIIGAKVFVYNLLGELIQTKELYNGLNSINLNVSGIYVIKVVDNNYVFSKIVIV
jgi:PKD repeat protein